MVLAATDHPVSPLAEQPPVRAARRGPLTAQQGLAVTRRDVSVVLSSGAGCGKTHVLTERYLSHLREDGADVSQIVAITFTDRAARLMRERIRHAVLHELRTASDREAGRWASHLRALESAQISTIHSFCAALLRQHAVEAGLDPRFEVLEGVLSASLLAETRTTSLQELLVARTEAGDDLRHLIVLYGWRPATGAVQDLVLAHDEPAWQEWLARTDEDIVAHWQGPERARLLTQYLEYLAAGSPRIARTLWLLRNTECKGPKMRVHVARLLEEIPRLGEARDLTAAVKELVEAAKVGPERAKAWPSDEVYQAVKNAFEGFRAELPKQLALFGEPVGDVAEAVATGKRFLRVAAKVIEAYQKRKRRNGVLDFQDLLVLARNLLRDRPEVREQLQRRFHHLLVDELQDTDPVQMELVGHLCGGELTAGKLFAVGDHKQSIYRFRGADVRQFQQLRLSMPHEGRLGLTVNFRSQPAILHFTNALFAGRLQDYEPLAPHHQQINPGPCVEFLWSPREDRQSVNESRATEADWIARRIAGMVNRGEELASEEIEGKKQLRPVQYGDVVLLFRAMSNVHLYEAALRKYGIDYYLVGGRAFFAQQEIYDLLNLLRALENPRDSLSLAGTLRSPFCCLSDEALFLLSRNREGLWAGLHDDTLCSTLPDDQRPILARARHNLERWHERKDRLPIARLLGEVFADSGYDAAVQFEFLGERKLANLWKLLEQARTFDRSGLFGLADFIARLGDQVATQPREEQAATLPESANVVRLMSIHQAKGLEFPVVFVPDLGATGRGPYTPVALWDARLGCVARPPSDEEEPPLSDFGSRLWKASEAVEEWHEDLRTLYVACTRAEDYLVLSAALTTPNSPANAWMLALADRFDLDRGQCLASGLDPDTVPAVRVVAGVPPATYQRKGGRGTEEDARSTRRDTAPIVPGSDAWPDDVAAVPLRQTARRVFRLEEVAAYLRQDEDAEAVAVTSAEVAWQFDTEDGSDRTSWLPPHERVGTTPDGANSAAERCLHAVLERWDLSDPEDWRSLLAQAPVTAEMALADLSAGLERFSGSEVFGELTSAVRCFRGVEYFLDLPVEGKGLAGNPARALRGVLDFLWQDGEGAWHLLALAASGPAPRRGDKTWNGNRMALVLAAAALQAQLGGWPATIGLYHLPSGTLYRISGRRLALRPTLAAARTAVNAISRQPLSE